MKSNTERVRIKSGGTELPFDFLYSKVTKFFRTADNLIRVPISDVSHVFYQGSWLDVDSFEALWDKEGRACRSNTRRRTGRKNMESADSGNFVDNAVDVLSVLASHQDLDWFQEVFGEDKGRHFFRTFDREPIKKSLRVIRNMDLESRRQLSDWVRDNLKA